MAGYKDKHGKFIKEPGTLRFKVEHKESEPTEFLAPVKYIRNELGYLCPFEKRVIPFREQYQDTHQLNDAEIV